MQIRQINLHHSRAASTLDDSNCSKFVYRGTPQGGVLKLLQWLLVINELLVLMESNRYETIAYEDDVVIVLKVKCPQILCNVMSNALKILSCWADFCGLSTNPM